MSSVTSITAQPISNNSVELDEKFPCKDQVAKVDAICGKIFLQYDEFMISHGLTSATFAKKSWGVPMGPHRDFVVDVMGEPYLLIKVYSNESIKNCKDNHATCERFYWQGSWHDDFAPVKNFPAALPLRFFMNKDGTLKDEGDTIKLIYDGKPVLLTCQHKNHKYNDQKIVSFREAIQKRIDHSLKYHYITSSDIEEAKERVQNSKEEWIDSTDKSI